MYSMILLCLYRLQSYRISVKKKYINYQQARCMCIYVLTNVKVISKNTNAVYSCSSGLQMTQSIPQKSFIKGTVSTYAPCSSV